MSPGQEAETTTPRQLLIVDDDRLVLKVVEEFFRPHGYVVVSALDGAEALARIEEATPDIIVADVLMPNLDGWALFEEVRRRPDAVHVPFIFLTTESELPQRLRGFHMGADDYVTKPFDVEELHARVERILRRHERIKEVIDDPDALLTGSVLHLPLSDLLQILALNGKDGIVILRRGADEGQIVFEKGNIVHATCERVGGVKALYRMLGWSSASFRVMPRPGEPPERTVSESTTNVLMDGLVSLDEWNRWSGLLPEAGTSVEITADAKARLDPQRITAAELEVMARAREGATVEQILERSPLPDADLAEAMCTLLTRGVLRAGGAG